jgi:hypothetical protein
MPLWFFPALLGLCAVLALLSGLWLLLHLQAVATMVRGHADVVPAPSKPRASRGAVWTAFALFNLGWIASVAIWTFALTGEANEVVEQDSGQV